MEKVNRPKYSEASSGINAGQKDIDTKNLLELLNLHQTLTKRNIEEKRKLKLFYPSILKALIGVVGRDFLLCGIFRVSVDLLSFIPPILLG